VDHPQVKSEDLEETKEPVKDVENLRRVLFVIPFGVPRSSKSFIMDELKSVIGDTDNMTYQSIS
jgi:hypothetical protein